MYLQQEKSSGPVLRLNIGKTPPKCVVVPVISRPIGYTLKGVENLNNTTLLINIFRHMLVH